MILAFLGAWIIGMIPATFVAIESYNQLEDTELIATVILWPLSVVIICMLGVSSLYKKHYGE